MVALALGNATFALFVRAVFRRDSRWATWLVAAIAASLAAGVVGSAFVGDWEGINPLANPWYWLEFIGGLGPSMWIGIEGIAHYLRARRRLKLGLCAVIDCYRFLLWGAAGLIWLLLEAIRSANDFVLAFTGRWSELLNLGTAVCEVVPVALIWCAFFPPECYRRWLEIGANPASALPPAID